MSPVPQPEEERDRPNHEEAEIETSDFPDVIINADSSDDDNDDNNDDDDDDGYMGYQALSMNNDNSDSDEEETGYEDSVENLGEGFEGQQTPNVHVPEGVIQQVRLQQNSDGSSTLPTYMQVPEQPRPDKDDLLWNQPRPSDISLETGQEEKIKSVMSGFKLPTCNIPDWAKGLSDDQWQTQVVNQLKGTSPETGSRQLETGSGLTFTKTNCERTGSDNQCKTTADSSGGGLNSPD